jgi:CubicO group peptidase (beta-lactamase class C family)
MSVEGHVAPGWEPVRDAFQRNFDGANELGAAVAVYQGAECVVDLWGGVADARSDAAWQRDTVVPVFSTTKGAAAVCAHMLVERGELDLDAPVADYWPDFAAAGKASVPVRWLLTHQVGLPYTDKDLTYDDLRAVEPVIRALEEQAPLWEPGSAVAYHAVTYGHLVGELVRRVTGRTLGTFFADEVARPLGLQAWIGLPEDQALSLAHVERVRFEVPEQLAELMGGASSFGRSITLGQALPFELVTGEPGDFNDRRLLAVELGGSSMVCDARSLARLYGATVAEVDGRRLLSDETVRRASVVQTREVPYFGLPEALGQLHLMDFALGFMPAPVVGEGTTFGHGGAGGSLGFGALELGVGFGYVMNRMDAVAPDTRAASLVEAVVACASPDRGS